jgi:hypothetical protein
MSIFFHEQIMKRLSKNHERPAFLERHERFAEPSEPKDTGRTFGGASFSLQPGLQPLNLGLKFGIEITIRRTSSILGSRLLFFD